MRASRAVLATIDAAAIAPTRESPRMKARCGTSRPGRWTASKRTRVGVDAGAREVLEGPAHREERRVDDAERVDLRGGRRADGGPGGRGADADVEVLANLGQEGLGVVEAEERLRPLERDGARVDRSREAAPSDFVDAGDQPVALGARVVLDAKQRGDTFPFRPQVACIPAGARSHRASTVPRPGTTRGGECGA